jgi:predicted MFS family arabinose efflux permease
MILARLALPAGLRLPVHALGATQIITWGTTFYAPAVLAPPVAAETGWSRTAVFGAFSLSMLLGAALAKPAGRLIDRHGGRLLMALGSALAASGLLLAAVATTLPVYVGAWLVLGLAMRFALYEAAFATLAAAAGRDARRAISVLTLYGGLASTIFWPIGYALVEAAGWRAAFAVYAAFNLLVCLPLHLFALPRAARGAEPAPGAAPAPGTAGALETAAERRLALWLLTLVFALFSFVNSALSAHLVDTLVALGIPAAEAVTLASLRGIGQVAGRFWEILFAGALAPMRLCLVAVGLTPLAFAALAFGASLLSAGLFTFLQGASNGLVTIARGVVPLLLFGSAGYGALIGAMSGPALVAAAVAPAIQAAVVDFAGYRAALLLDAVAAALAVAMVLLLARLLARARA